MLMYMCTYLILIPFEDCETHERHERYCNVVTLYTIIYIIIYIYIYYIVIVIDIDLVIYIYIYKICQMMTITSFG